MIVNSADITDASLLSPPTVLLKKIKLTLIAGLQRKSTHPIIRIEVRVCTNRSSRMYEYKFTYVRIEVHVCTHERDTPRNFNVVVKIGEYAIWDG